MSVKVAPQSSLLSPLVLDPRKVPITAVDQHLPALSREHLTRCYIAERLTHAWGWAPPLLGDGTLNDAPPVAQKDASVLVMLEPFRAEEFEGPSVLLTRRPQHLRRHAGQISFPGGRREATDVDACETALREASEEIGLLSSVVRILGVMPAYHTVTGFSVTPVVAWQDAEFVARPDPQEVDEVFRVPLVFLMNPANHRWHCCTLPNGLKRKFLSMPWVSPSGAEYFIWGATAAMLRNFYHLLAE